MPAAMVITDTGTRGLLKWIRDQYPAAIYGQVAQQFHQRVPQAFSGYMLGGWRVEARRRGFADAAATVDTADAANSTPMDPSWGNILNSLLGTATAAYLDIKQQQQQQQVINTQLQQAQNGGAPRPITLSSNGITFGSAGVGVGTVLLIAGLGFLGLKAAGVIK